MRRLALPLLALALAAGTALLLLRDEPRPAATRSIPSVARPAGAAPLGAPVVATEPLELTLPADAGGLEVRVTSGGAPVGGAALRVYLHRPIEPGTGRPGWRLAAAAATGGDGLARVPAAPGAYLVSARAPGLAAGSVELVRPAGERYTPVELALSPPLALRCRTVDAATGEPVTGADLALSREPARGAPRGDLPAEEQLHAASDGRGAARVEGLAPGRYTLRAEAPGHARVRLGGVEVPREGTLEVALPAAGLVEGLVLDAAGRPAEGAEVSFSGGEEVLVVTSGPSGGFAAELSPRAWRVAARRGDAGAALPGAVAVAAGQAVRGLVLRLGAPAAIEGQVVTRAGAPVAGASLGLSPAEHGGEFGRVLSDAAGRFAFRGLAPGEYDLDAGADGLGTALRRGLTVAAGDRFELTLTLSGTGAVEGTVTDGAGGPVAGARLRGGTLWGTLGEVDAEAISGDDGRYRLAGLAPGRVRVEGRRPGAASSSSALVLVEEGRTARADLTLAATGALEGTVRRRSGAPAADGVRVVAVAGGPGASMARGGGALEVEAGGRFAASLGEGSWRLYATAGSGHAASRPVEQAVEVRAGRTARVELVLDDPPPEQDRLTVEVREPGGAPAPGALVFVARAGGGRGAAVVLADEAGRLEISGRDGQPASQGLSLGARSGGRTAPLAPVAAGATAVVQLRPAAEVRGRVVEGGRPVSGFHLALELPDEEALGLDLGLGRELPGSTFDLADVPAGALRLTATTPDGRTGAVEASVAPGAAAEVVIELRREGTVTGRVVDAAGAPVAGAFVMLGGRDPSADGGTGADGRFRLQAVPPGRQEVQAFVPRTGSAARSFEISAGQELDLGDLVLSPSGGGHP